MDIWVVSASQLFMFIAGIPLQLRLRTCHRPLWCSSASAPYTVCSYLHSVVAGGWPVVLFSSNCYKVTCTWFAYIVLLNLWLLLVNLFSYCLLFMNPRHVLHHQADRWLSSVGDKPGLQRQLQDSRVQRNNPPSLSPFFPFLPFPSSSSPLNRVSRLRLGWSWTVV